MAPEITYQIPKVRALVRVLITQENDAQKGCAMQLKGITLKQPSHVKRMLANVCWQIQIGVCERHNNMLANCWRKVGENRDKFYFSPTVCQHVVVSFTHTNLSLPTRVGPN